MRLILVDKTVEARDVGFDSESRGTIGNEHYSQNEKGDENRPLIVSNSADRLLDKA